MPKKRRAKARRLPLAINPEKSPPPPLEQSNPSSTPTPAPATESAPMLPAPPPGLDLPPEPESDASASSSIDPAAVRTLEALDQRAGVAAGLEAPGPGDGSQAAASPGDSATPAPIGGDAIPFDAWFALMHGAFGLAAELAKLKSLAFDKASPTAAPAFQALYDTAAETPALRFLIAPQGKWFGRAAAVAAFALPMAQGVRAELAARRGVARSSSAPAASAPPPGAAPTIPGVPSAAFYDGLRKATSPYPPGSVADDAFRKAELGAHE